MLRFILLLFMLAQVIDAPTVHAVTSQNVIVSNGFLAGGTVSDFGAVFNLAGDNFAAEESAGSSIPLRLWLVSPGFGVIGSPLNLSGTVMGEVSNCGRCSGLVVTVNSTVFQPPTAEFSFHWNFSSVMSSVPGICNSCSAPFSFNGTLNVREGGTPIYELALTGSGLAFPRFIGGLGTPNNPYLLGGVTYNFVPLAVPEPTTISLLFGPIVFLLARGLASECPKSRLSPDALAQRQGLE